MLFFIAALAAQVAPAPGIPREQFSSVTAADFLSKCARVSSDADAEWAFCDGAIATMRDSVVRDVGARHLCDQSGLSERTLYYFVIGEVYAAPRPAKTNADAALQNALGDLLDCSGDRAVATAQPQQGQPAPQAQAAGKNSGLMGKLGQVLSDPAATAALTNSLSQLAGAVGRRGAAAQPAQGQPVDPQAAQPPQGQ